jgi:ABC-type branched-subunit amino acid transport system substrate-binding protein
MREYSMTAIAVAAVLGIAGPTLAAGHYGPGVTDSEIKLGNTTPYSGPVSSVATTAKAELAYFAMVNAAGGVNGRKITFLSLDDAYSPSKTIEQTRKLVESDDVLAIVATPGTPTNMAILKYLNQKQVPNLLIGSGATVFDDPKTYPWSQPFTPSVDMEGRVYARYVLQAKPEGKIAILYQNDDFGKGMLKGFKKGLGAKAASMIVREASYEVTDPTVDSQIVTLQGSGADVVMEIATPKFGAQAIRRVSDLGWKPLQLINWASSSISGTLEPAGLEKAIGLLSAMVFKVPNDPTWKHDKDVQEYRAFLKRWYPDGDPADVYIVQGYIQAQLTVMMLKACGDELTRENLMKQATSFRDTSVAMLMPGIKIEMRPGSYAMFHQLQMVQFDGKSWVRHGDVISGDELK